MAVISCISLFFCKHEKPALRGRGLRARNKKPGAVSRPGGWRSFGEYLFWKILVTRVKRKVDQFDRSGFQGDEDRFGRRCAKVRTPPLRCRNELSRRGLLEDKRL